MLDYVTLAVTLAMLAVALYTLHKVRRIHLMLYAAQSQAERLSDTSFQQLQALLALHLDLGLTRSLPATRGWAASPDFLRELYRHALAEKPRLVLECSSGTSTLVLARCMQMNGAGKVLSLEHDPIFAAQTRSNLASHGLEQWADVIDAPLQVLDGEQRWYARDAIPEKLVVDMLVIDGPPSAIHPRARHPAGTVLFPLLAPGASVFLDDADRAEEQATLALWRQEFPELEVSTRHCEKGCAVLHRPGPAR